MSEKNPSLELSIVFSGLPSSSTASPQALSLQQTTIPVGVGSVVDHAVGNADAELQIAPYPSLSEPYLGQISGVLSSSPRDITTVQIIVEDRRIISLEFDVSLSDTVSALKAQIEEYTGQPIGTAIKEASFLLSLTSMTCVARQRLQIEYVDEAIQHSLYYTELQDDETLELYEIEEGTVLSLSIQASWILFVKTLTGSTLSCFTPQHKTVATLKMEIWEMKGVPPGTPY
jgi:hypothetical protein